MSKKDAGGEKVYSWKEQGELLHDRKGIPVNELNNVTNGLIGLRQDLIAENVAKNVQKICFEDPNGSFGLELHPKQTRRNADGATFEVPDHYEGFSYFNKKYVEIANSGLEVTPKLISKGGEQKKSKAA